MRKTDDITSLAKKARLLAKTRKKKFRMMQHKRVEHDESEASEDELIQRLKECDSCGALSKPLLNQVTFLHDFRQMIVYWQNTVRLICYEAAEWKNPPG